MAYVICVNDYPVEVSFLDEEGTQERVRVMQERLNAEDGVDNNPNGWGVRRFVHWHHCPVIASQEAENVEKEMVKGAEEKGFF